MLLRESVFIYGVIVTIIYVSYQYISTQIHQTRCHRKYNCLPPRHIPQVDRILGLDLMILQLRKTARKRLLLSNVSVHNRYGATFTATAMLRKFIVTNDPENIQAVLATKFHDFQLGSRLKFFGPLLGRGIFTSDGHDWSNSRSIIRPSFAKKQFTNLDDYELLVQRMISLIPQDEKSVDLQSLFFRLSLDSSTKLLFGKSAGTLDPEQPVSSKEFASAFDYAQDQLSLRQRLGGMVWLYRNRKFDESCRTVHDYVDILVKDAIADYRLDSPPKEDTANSSSQKRPYVLLEEMLSQVHDPKRLRSELLNVLLAGRDTTAGLLSAVFFVLARRPDIWQTLQEEIKTLGGQKPDYEALHKLRYLRYVINEALRLYPPVPVNLREAVQDTVLPVGGGPDGRSPIFISKGTAVYYSAFALHRRKDVYGPDANEFRPERWTTLRPGWCYVPFNGGPRICIGQQLALTHACYATVRLLQTFASIRTVDPNPWKEHLHLTLSIDNGVNVVMTR